MLDKYVRSLIVLSLNSSKSTRGLDALSSLREVGGRHALLGSRTPRGGHRHGLPPVCRCVVGWPSRR
jgi:hypothetical protein